MTTNDAQTEQEFIVSQKAKTSGKGFAPAKKPNPKPPTAAPESTQHPIAPSNPAPGRFKKRSDQWQDIPLKAPKRLPHSAR